MRTKLTTVWENPKSEIRNPIHCDGATARRVGYRLLALGYLSALLCLLSSALCPPSFAQGTAFTYQGRLTDGGNPASGAYDLRFTIYDSTNNPGTVVAGPLTNSAVAISNGLFVVALDFGAGPFTNGVARWLEIGVRTNGSGAFTTLAARQSIAPSPYSMFAGRVNASGINGIIAAANLSGTYGNGVTFSNAANSFSGNGAGLTGLLASQLTSGTVADARLSPNVALRNTTNTFTGNQAIISGNLAIGTNVAGARLEVAGQIKITGGSPGSGKVLTSDNAGLATWTAPDTIARVVTVDASGNGDYTTINAALAAINPSATNPFVIFVRPGTYVETVWLKSFVHLKGAGRDYTFLEADPVGATNDLSRVAIGLDHLTNVMISGFTLSPHTNTGALGIYDNASSPVITDNVFDSFTGALGNFPDRICGIFSMDSSPVIQRNVFTNWYYFSSQLYLRRSPALISENEFLQANFADHVALYLESSSAQILANVFERISGCVILATPPATNELFTTIAYNRFENGWYCVHSRGKTQIIGNYFNGFAGPPAGGFQNFGAAVIAANVFTNCDVTDFTDIGTSYSGNSFQGSATFRIESGNPVITGNYFDSIDLRINGSPTVTGNRLDSVLVTGGTPIFSGNYSPSNSFTGTAILTELGPASLQLNGSNLLVYTSGFMDIRSKLMVTNDTATFRDASVIGALTVGGTGQFTNALSAGSLNIVGPATFNSLLNATLLDVSGPATFDSLVSAAVFTGDGSALTGIHSLDAADGNPTDAVFVNNSGKVGVGLVNPLHRLHVGTTLGTNAFNASTNVIAIEDANENGRATFLALAGIGGPDTTNRVEVQVEAVESSRRGIIGTTTEHPVYLRVGNSDTMVLATNRFVGIGTNSPAERLHVVGNILATGTITPNSDRNAKTDVRPVDVSSILDRVSTLPIQQWRFKTESDQVKHVGPMAQDFRAAFGLGAHETAIATVDADGVALAAIQGLNQKLDSENAKLREGLKQKDTEITELKQRLDALEKLFAIKIQIKERSEGLKNELKRRDAENPELKQTTR